MSQGLYSVTILQSNPENHLARSWPKRKACNSLMSGSPVQAACRKGFLYSILMASLFSNIHELTCINYVLLLPKLCSHLRSQCELPR